MSDTAARNSVVATARRVDQILAQLPDAGESLLAADLDVTNAELATEAVQSAVDTFGRQLIQRKYSAS